MAENTERRLRPAEVEMILRRASELNARRWERGAEGVPSVSPEVLVQVAAAAGIPEQDVRRAMWDLVSEKTAEPHSLAWKLYAPARLRAVREVDRPAGRTREPPARLLTPGARPPARRAPPRARRPVAPRRPPEAGRGPQGPPQGGGGLALGPRRRAGHGPPRPRLLRR